MAIQLNPGQAKYYGNRSQAKLKLQDFEGALKDANESIELDQTYTKARYKKALAYKGLRNYEAALEELRQLHKDDPNEQNIRNTMHECENLLLPQGNVV